MRARTQPEQAKVVSWIVMAGRRCGGLVFGMGGAVRRGSW